MSPSDYERTEQGDDPSMSDDDALFDEARKLFDRKPIKDVMPVLITAVARALVLDAGGDLTQLAVLTAKFYAILVDQMTDMLDEGKGETLQ